MKIKKGKKYECVKWCGRIFKVGEIYESIKNGRLIDEDGDSVDPYFYDDHCVFELVEEPTIEELLKRIEALEKRLQKQYLIEIMKGDEELGLYKQPCETSAKFKAIADYANAISEIIKNAPE